MGENYTEVFVNGRSAGYPTVPNAWWGTSRLVTVGSTVARPNVVRIPWKGNISQVCVRNRRRYSDRFEPVQDLRYIMGGTDVLFFLGTGLTNNTGVINVATPLAVTGSVPTVRRQAEDAT